MCAISLQLGDRSDGETDAADDEIRWHLVGAESEQLHGVIELKRAQDEAIVFEFSEPELQSVADPHGKDRWLRRLISDRRVVVAVEDGDGLGRQHGLHAGGLLPGETHRDEAGPSAARGGTARAHLLEHAKRQLHQVERCRAGRYGIVDGRARCHNGNCSMADGACGFTRTGGAVIERKQISDGEHLCGEKTIETIDAESAAAAQEIGDMRGLKSGLAGEESSIHTASIDPPEEFQTETLLQLSEVHCGKLASR
jgi:hypothetical protein